MKSFSKNFLGFNHHNMFYLFLGDEFIKLANEDDRGWCLGKHGTKIGLYPATYANNM